MAQQPRLAPCVPLPLDSKVLVSIVEKAKDWALMHGVGMRDRKHFTKDSLQIAPFVLFPSPFPRTEFLKAVELQPMLNELMHKVSHDAEFLEQTLQNALQVDEFTNNLYKIWVKVQQEGVSQSVSLGLFRSDYLMHAPDLNKMKQVEFNTIASSFGAMTSYLPSMYRYILRQLGHGELIKNMPENRALSGLCAGIIEAYDLFGVAGAVVLFVVEEVSYNICDQRFHEFEISEKRPDIQIYRKTLGEIYEETDMNDKKQLILEDRPVAVVYYRSGYEPAQYPSAREWDARLRVERSTAIKCPSIHYQLAGTKKVQQALAAPGALERFMGTDGAAARVRDIFTGLYSLDFDDSGERALEMALADADRFVLKPQREGGGNNVYGAEIREALLRMRHSRERAAYILMERILPPLVSGYVVRAGGPLPPQPADLVSELGIFGVIVGHILMERILPPLVSGYVVRAGGPLPPQPADLVSELGIFGVIVGTKDKIYLNRQVGHMLRTKLAEANEGGVAAGLGALDSPYLVDL